MQQVVRSEVTNCLWLDKCKKAAAVVTDLYLQTSLLGCE